MAKRKRVSTTKSIAKKVLEGRCKHDGKEYIPWYKVQDVASKGTSLKTFSLLTQRQHHLLSRLETYYFYLLEWSDSVIDIKEQYAILDVDETIRIAAELGYRHPRDPKTKNIVPITTDFLIEIEKGGEKQLVSRTVKYKKDLSKRTLEKFEIERRYWESKNVNWGIFTEEMLDKNLINNIIWVRKAKSLDGLSDLNEDLVSTIEAALWSEIQTNNRPITQIASEVTNNHRLQPGTGLFVVRYLIANKLWKIDMFKPVNPDTTLEIQERIVL